MSLNHEPSDHPNEATDARLDEHIAALTAFAANQSPSPELLSKTLATLNAPEPSVMRMRDDGDDRGSIPIRKKPFMSFPQRIYAAISLTAAACLIWFLFVLFGSAGATIAYAQVVEKITKARGLAYTASIDMGTETPRRTVRMIFAEGERSRIELDDSHVAIRNGDETLILDEKGRKATRLELTGLPTTRRAQPTNATDLVAALKQISTGEAEPLGEKTIDGVAAMGFKSHWAKNYTLVTWADKKTAEPIRVEMSMDMGPKPVVIVMDHFDTAPQVDAAMFSTAVPAGYTTDVQKMDVTNMVPGKAAEAVAAFLKAYSDVNDGSFPPNLEDWAKLQKIDNDKMKPGINPHVIEGLSAQLFSMPGGYHYLGNGVKRGDKDAVIFWYTPKDAKLSRAVYGDLRIADVETAKLPTTMPVK